MILIFVATVVVTPFVAVYGVHATSRRAKLILVLALVAGATAWVTVGDESLQWAWSTSGNRPERPADPSIAELDSSGAEPRVIPGLLFLTSGDQELLAMGYTREEIDHAYRNPERYRFLSSEPWKKMAEYRERKDRIRDARKKVGIGVGAVFCAYWWTLAFLGALIDTNNWLTKRRSG